MPDTIRDCQRCRGQTKAGTRCTRVTCKLANLCWQHLKSSLHLVVKKSGIPDAGLGLFTTVDIEVSGRKKKIVRYSATSAYMTKESEAEIDARYGDDTNVSPYVWCGSKNRCYDARSTQSTVARYSNGCDRPGGKKICNAEISLNGWIVATQSIKAGSEIFVPYGPEYWQ